MTLSKTTAARDAAPGNYTTLSPSSIRNQAAGAFFALPCSSEESTEATLISSPEELPEGIARHWCDHHFIVIYTGRDIPFFACHAVHRPHQLFGPDGRILRGGAGALHLIDITRPGSPASELNGQNLFSRLVPSGTASAAQAVTTALELSLQASRASVGLGLASSGSAITLAAPMEHREQALQKVLKTAAGHGLSVIAACDDDAASLISSIPTADHATALIPSTAFPDTDCPEDLLADGVIAALRGGACHIGELSEPGNLTVSVIGADKSCLGIVRRLLSSGSRVNLAGVSGSILTEAIQQFIENGRLRVIPADGILSVPADAICPCSPLKLSDEDPAALRMRGVRLICGPAPVLSASGDLNGLIDSLHSSGIQLIPDELAHSGTQLFINRALSRADASPTPVSHDNFRYIERAVGHGLRLSAQGDTPLPAVIRRHLDDLIRSNGLTDRHAFIEDLRQWSSSPHPLAAPTIKGLFSFPGGERVQADSLGDVRLPEKTYYGPQTERGRKSFDVSGRAIGENREFIEALARVKKAAARTSMHLGSLSSAKGKAIILAAEEIILGGLTDAFPVDWLQGGGGVAMNMNINEVIAVRAGEILTGKRAISVVHPNDDVNLNHSTNDAVHAALHLTFLNLHGRLEKALRHLEAILHAKVIEFKDVVKLGRTCLQDAVPLTMGQFFSGYLAFVTRQRKLLAALEPALCRTGMGATGIGTGLGMEPGFLEGFYNEISRDSGFRLQASDNFFDTLQNADPLLDVSARLKSIAVGLGKMASDMRLLSTGPRTGMRELRLPAAQPGSSIMPGKVNPTIPELMNQIVYRVCGNDQSVTMAAEGGELDLNVWEALILEAVCESYRLLTNGITIFADRCIAGVEADREVCTAGAEGSLALSTVVSEVLGYKAGLKASAYANENGCSIREAVIALGLMTDDQARELLSPALLTDRIRYAEALKKHRKIQDSKNA